MLLQFKGDSLTSSEPSRQLSCPSQRRLADTQPPLVHTYSLTEQDGTTAEEKSVTGGCVRLWLVGDSSDLTEYTLSYSQWTKRKCFFDLQKNNNYKLNSSHLQYKQCCGQQRLHKGGRLCGSECGGSFLHLFPGSFFHLHPSCSLPARHTTTSSRCTGCCDSETGRLSSVPHSLSAIKHSEKHQGHVQRPAAGLFPAPPPCWAETEDDIIHSKTAHAEEFDTIGHNEGTQRRADKRSHERNRCSNTSRPTLLEPRSAPTATCTLWLRRRSASSICVCEHRVRTTRVVSEKSCLNVHVVYSAEHFKWSIRIQSCINAVHYKLTM